jgi:single-stranded-DNA-specific exonuclease
LGLISLGLGSCAKYYLRQIELENNNMHYHGITKKIVERPLLGRYAGVSEQHKILKRIYLARDIKSDTELQRGLAQLPSPWLLTGMEEMVLYLINAIEQQKKIVIVADFDADGATSCAR